LNNKFKIGFSFIINMHGNAEFLILFVPFFVIGIGAIYATLFFPMFFIFHILLWIVGVLCLGIDVFALMVQYVNWKYYRE